MFEDFSLDCRAREALNQTCASSNQLAQGQVGKWVCRALNKTSNKKFSNLHLLLAVEKIVLHVISKRCMDFLQYAADLISRHTVLQGLLLCSK